jgi:hypothetical protein
MPRGRSTAPCSKRLQSRKAPPGVPRRRPRACREAPAARPVGRPRAAARAGRGQEARARHGRRPARPTRRGGGPRAGHAPPRARAPPARSGSGRARPRSSPCPRPRRRADQGRAPARARAGAVAARRGRQPALGEDNRAGRGGNDGERVGVAMRIDADHEIDFLCKHLCYPQIARGRAGARSGEGSRSRQCREKSRPRGGQASDHASQRSARPVPARSPGQLVAKTPPQGVSKTSSHERARTATSPAIGPDETPSLSQQDLTRQLHLMRFGAY